MRANQLMDEGTAAVHGALIDTGQIGASIGVGKHAQRELGQSAAQIGQRLFKEQIPLSDGGATFVDVRYPLDKTKHVRLYIQRQGKFLEVGTRADFRDLGFEPVCDMLDRQALAGIAN